MCNLSKAYVCTKLSMHLFTVCVVPTSLEHTPRNMVSGQCDKEMEAWSLEREKEAFIVAYLNNKLCPNLATAIFHHTFKNGKS